MPILTLTTDFGQQDYLVAAVKGQLYSAYKGFTIVDGGKLPADSPVAVIISGKLWRFDYSGDGYGTMDLNFWTQLSISDGAGKSIGKDTIKVSNRYAPKEGKAGIERDLRLQIDYVATQAALLAINSQSKLIADALAKSENENIAAALTPNAIGKFKQAMQGYLEEIETLEMQSQTTMASQKQAKEASDNTINALRGMQNSLDGVRATLPTK